MALSLSDLDTSKVGSKWVTGRSRRGALGVCLFIFIAASVAVVISSALFGQKDQFHNGRGQASGWGDQYASTVREYVNWFVVTPLEGQGNAHLFQSMADSLYKSAVLVRPPTESFESMGFFSNAYISLHFGALRLIFVVLAWWRLWLLVAIAGIYLGLKSWKPYLVMSDFLGTCSNGRLFYSGVRADLRKATKDAAPDALAPGLACPRMVSETEAQNSHIAKVLGKYNAHNATNITLASIILCHKEWPAYVAKRDERELLEKAFEGASLPDHCVVLLETVLAVHAHLTEEPSHASPRRLSAANSEQFCAELAKSLYSSLSPDLKSVLAEIPASELATVLLAMESGKAMAYGREGQRWVLTSRYPQLCARAFLHSVAAFSREYGYSERARIRHAIIYGSRRSIFGPVKFPVDLSPQARALRQWVELFMACPHEIGDAAEEVELYGILNEAHQHWQTKLLDGVMTRQVEFTKGIYTANNLFFMPLDVVMKTMRSAISSKDLARLAQLVATVSARQQLKAGLNPSSDGAESRYLSYDRIFPPLTESEVKEIVSEHKVNAADLVEWSSARAIVDAYSWLGRRVGSFTVPDSSIITVLARMDDGKEQKLSGVVAFRGTKLKERWGEGWSSRFIQAASIKMTGKGYENDDFYESGSSGEIDGNFKGF